MGQLRWSESLDSVDLGEVEAAIARETGATAAAVVFEHDGRGRSVLTAHVSPVAAADPTSLRTKLRRTLADHKVPVIVVGWKALPATSGGTIDEAALHARVLALRQPMLEPTIELPVAHEVDPDDRLEEQLLAIWREFLVMDQLGLDDDFLDLGGDSLLAYELVYAIKERLGRSISPASLLQASTVRAQAAVVRIGGAEPQLLHSVRDGRIDSPVLFVHGGGGSAWYASELQDCVEPERAVYSFEVPSLEWLESIESFDDLVAQYADAVVAMGTSGPVTIFGYSYGGLVAWDLVKRLHEATDIRVDKIIVGDSFVSGVHDDLWPDTSSRSVEAKRRIAQTFDRVIDAGQGKADGLQYLKNRLRLTKWKPGERAPRRTEHKDINARFVEMTSGWRPEPLDVDVGVLCTDESVAYVTAVWKPVAHGRFAIRMVRHSTHLQLVGKRIRGTRRALTKLLSF